MFSTVRHNAEKARVEVSGRLIKMTYDYMFQYVKGQKKQLGTEKVYQYAIVTKNPDEDLKGEILAEYYGNADEQYKPKWLKSDAETDENGNVIVNLKSRYDIKYFAKDETGKDVCYSSLEELTAAKGNLLGSQVTASIRCKEGAMYIVALRIDKESAVTADAYFE